MSEQLETRRVDCLADAGTLDDACTQCGLAGDPFIGLCVGCANEYYAEADALTERALREQERWSNE